MKMIFDPACLDRFDLIFSCNTIEMILDSVFNVLGDDPASVLG